MSRSPNPEQQLAIQHTGGVLLKAGAGSGKTFVLVEHIVYLTQRWIEEFKNNPQGNFEEKIRSEFSKIVMMTFTKKAAGEMSIRLSDRFQALRDVDPFWSTAASCLPILTVTTIDGFCRKLITSGYLPHLSTEAKVIFSAERMDQVKLIYEKWFTSEAHKISADLLDIVVREKEEILKSICGAFDDSTLRKSWNEFGPESLSLKSVGRVLHDAFVLENLDQDLLAIHAVETSTEEPTAFERNIQQFQATGLPVIDDVEKLRIYSSIFENISLTAPSKKIKTPVTTEAQEALKRLKKWVQNKIPTVESFVEHHEDRIIPWASLFREIFLYIEKRLDPNQGMTFADIAYYVEQGLRDKEILARIHAAYKYFIVDEFQDTSSLQFEIIRNLIGNNFSNLFCVGDPKQAIYGFRGGELSVFQNCSSLVPKVLSLSNNYRSLPDVINFNNSLFSSVLPLGRHYEGIDSFTVDAEGQTVPTEVGHDSEGEIEVLTLDLIKEIDDENKLNYDQINRIEASLLLNAIKKQRLLHPKEVCTVLYRKLQPSIELIQGLIKEKIGFTAQFKIQLMDDPVMGIFLSLLYRNFDKRVEERDKASLFLINNYFSILGIPIPDSIELSRFEEETRYWGLFEAFKKFIFKLNITNENSDINLDQIETLCKIYYQDPEAILLQLEDDSTPKLSLDFRSGLNSGMVQIMSAHSSKGLEYDTIYLGGIYTNCHESTRYPWFGKCPESFNYYTDLKTHKKERTPHYELEKKLELMKDFSEAKRLFYVACTRAKRKLSWVKINNILDSMSRPPKNSWAFGFNHWLEKSSDEVLNKIIETKVGELRLDDVFSEKSSPELPLFFYDSVGVHQKSGMANELGLMAELSVTRLNSLVDCPRKYYLQNILKLTPTSENKSWIGTENEDDEVVPRSSSERGTLIHAILSESINRNFIIPRQYFEGEFHEPLTWAISEMEPFRQEFDFYSETPLKFKFFNFMISGIPDLYLLPKSKGLSPQIWDFKTGSITQENLGHYWIQLKSYAYALYTLGMVSKEISIDIKLCFVDKRKILFETVTWDGIQNELFDIWKSQNEPWKIKTDHCSQCFYGDICPK